jgi:hypothetical protein
LEIYKLYFSGRNIDPLKTKRISFIQGSSGVNIIRAYTDDSNVNNATIAFIRNDGKQLGEFTMVHVTLDDDGVTAVNAYQIPLTDNLGALEVAGELGFTVYLKTVTVDAGGVSTTKTQATGKATAHVYDSVTKSDQISPDQAELEQLRESVEQIPSRVETAVNEETAGMNGEIDANAAAIAKEASDRQAADAKEVTDRNAAITEAANAEKTARESADAQEVTNRNTAISTHNQDASAHGDIRQLITNLQAIVTTIDAEDDANTVIDKLHEVVALLNGYAEGTTLIELLGGKIDKASITDSYASNDVAKVLSQKGANDLYTYLMSYIKYLNAFTDIVGGTLEVNWDNTTTDEASGLAIQNHFTSNGISSIKVGMSVLVHNIGNGYYRNNGFYNVNTHGYWLWVHSQDAVTEEYRFEPTIPIPQSDLSDLATKQELTDHNGNAEAHPAIRQLIADMQTAINNINSVIAVVDGQNDADSVINKLHEIVNLLAGYAEGTTLANLLSAKADKTEIPVVPTKVSDLTNDSNFTSLTIGTTALQAGRGDLTQTAYEHSQSAHAPSNAQKNSDITKAEIEAKLIGEVASHSHALPSHNHTKSQITDFTHNHTKSEISDFPTTMTPTAHTHTKSQITDFPTIPTNTVSSTTITTMVKLTQAEYDALGTKDANTFYVIVG